MLARVDAISADIASLDAAIAAHAAPLADLIARLDEIPGISLAAAHVILAEIGTGMTRSPPPGTWSPGPGWPPASRNRPATRTARAPPATATPTRPPFLVKPPPEPPRPAPSSANATGASPAAAAPSAPSSPSAGPSWSSPGTCCLTSPPSSTTSAPATTPHASTPNAASATTSASSKPSATPSPSSPPPEPAAPRTRLRCAPPGAAARPLTHRFSD